MSKLNLFKDLTASTLKKRKKTSMPNFVAPMLATLTTNYFSDENWIYEHKFDGERCLAFKKNGKVTLKSRNKNVINEKYPDLVAALTKQAADNFIIDGEIVALGKNGISDFQLLQGRINLTKPFKITEQSIKVPVHYCIFDLMYLDGYDLRGLELLDRKSILKNLLTFTSNLVYTEHKSKDCLKFFKKACSLKWEGLIVKEIHSTYQGVRSPNWLKFKCVMEEELIIAGYTGPRGSRLNFGALLVGYYQKDKLHYAGKVGTGYNEATLKMLGTKLKKLRIKECPFNDYDGQTQNVHWVSPKLVAQFRFAEWTNGGKLRAPRYKGLRDDKSAKEVVREG